MKFLLPLLTLAVLSYANDIIYTKNNTHAFLPKNNSVNIAIGVEAINDTIDVFNIKESEISSNSTNYDSLGDMTGINFELGYAFWDKFYIHSQYNRKDIGYLGTSLINNKIDLLLRYQVFTDENSAFAIDGGFAMNKAEDSRIDKLENVNTLLNKVSNDLNIENNVLTYKNSDGVTSTANLTITPYLAITDTKDTSLYLKGIYTYKSKDFLFDFFGGYKQISIDFSLDSSLNYEESLKSEIEDSDITAFSNQSREDGMFFAGFALREKFGSIFAEFIYQYNRMLRIEGLQEQLTNHTVNIDLTYPISNKVAIYLGGKIMSNQFNGDIPYIYNQYTQSSFDHKYGWAEAGLLVKF